MSETSLADQPPSEAVDSAALNSFFSTLSPKMIVLLILAAVLIILSAMFSASESAFFSINKLRLRLLRNKGDKKAIRAGKLLDNKEKLLNTILVGNEIVNISLSVLVTSICLELFGQSGMGYATLAVTIVLLIFGEIFPKTLATHNSERFAFFVAPFIKFVSVVVTPIVFSLSALVHGIAKLFHIKMESKKVSFSEEEIKQYIQVSEEEGVLESGEKQMMNRVFKFTDLSAHDIMTPRTKIRAVSINVSYRQLMELYQKTKFSHFPVYGEDLDDIKGILYMKDVLFGMAGMASDRERDKKFSAKDLMRQPFFILENKKMSSIQQMLDENKESVAIVIDEYSGTAGILTKKDIAEEIFGKFYDEYDSYYPSDLVRLSDSVAEIDGSARLNEVCELYDLQLESENYETLNGFLTEVFDGFPQEGEEIELSGCKFTILDASDRKINRVRLEKISDSAESDSEKTQNASEAAK